MSSSATMTTYNPQAWIGHTPPGARYLPHAATAEPRRFIATREMSGMEVSIPSPPPPYTESPTSTLNGQRAYLVSPHATSFASPLTASPTNHLPELNTPHSGAASVFPRAYASLQQSGLSTAPVVPSSSVFFPPPPPSQRDRSTSRIGRGQNFTSTTSRIRHWDSSIAPTTVEVLQSENESPLARAPLQPLQTLNCSELAPLPPASRRAASTGAIGHTSAPMQSHIWVGDIGRQALRNISYPLPPPPPLPSLSLRAQSLNRVYQRSANSESSESSLELNGRQRRKPMRNPQLDPIPPTPADWDERNSTSSEVALITTEDRPLQMDVRVDSIGNAQVKGFEIPHLSPGSRVRAESSSSASQSHAAHATVNRGSSSRGIRERRIERRATRVRSDPAEPQTAIEPSHVPWVDHYVEAKPANLVLSSSPGPLIRRGHVSKNAAKPSKPSPQSSGSTGGANRTRDITPTPLFMRGNSVEIEENSSRPTFPNASRTSPTISTKDFKESRRTHVTVVACENGTSSLEVCHRPDNARTVLEDHRQAECPSFSKIASSSPLSVNTMSFSLASLRRYETFIERESAVATDLERLELFAGFMVHESRLRRDRYAQAFENMGSNVLELTRDMWRPLDSTPRNRTTVAVPSETGRSTPQSDAPLDFMSPRDSTYGPPCTPNTEPDSPISETNLGKTRTEVQRQPTYRPILSPIPSMAMSTAPDINDEEGSRGRSASRWWEASTGAASIGVGRKIERSKRESKYMGLPREAREHLQWDGIEPSQLECGNVSGSSEHFNLGPDEYPEEKGAEQIEENAWAQMKHASSAGPAPPSPRIDCSRLVTLPPPYPRHHPAVNNNHPDLAVVRGILRQLNDRSNMADIRAQYEKDLLSKNSQTANTAHAATRRREVRRQMQEKISSGHLSFAEAAREEADFEAQECKRSQNVAQKEFNRFQSEVKNPLVTCFTEKLTKASTSMDMLRSSLEDSNHSYNPNQTQEEGDEHPELLEKITLMKWFFEAREQLYRDLFELEGESDELYKQVVLTSYSPGGNQEKLKEVKSFFSKDSEDRKVNHEEKASKRFEVFLQIVEQTVTRGIEVQLSAFWDIAPPLFAVVQKVPSDLHEFEVAIPWEEYGENPTYRDYPMQYLYTLLCHTEKSTYQLIESQTNLLCLLHEIKTGATGAKCKLLETQRLLAGEDPDVLEGEVQAIRRQEEGRLTSELKERVELVEDQWRQALGKGLADCKRRIRRFLVEQDGWDDSLEE